MKIHNFSPGPAILPAEVIREAAKAVANFNGMGLSILELSHRGPEITAVFDETVQLLRELMQIPDNYEVIFCTGGASAQFFMTAMNLLDENETAAFVNTGVWATKAIEAAANYGNVRVVASSKETTFDHIPKFKVPEDVKYFHITSNNTIYGTQYQKFPDTKSVPLICDMSSDFLSRPVDVSKFDLIYAGAQKNIGPAGVTIVIVKRELLGKVQRKIPVVFDYRTFIKEKSMYNTPPVYPVFVCMLTLRWLKKLGGLKNMERRNKIKANLLYREIDRNPLFRGTVAVKDRSTMNVCFLMNKPELEAEFAKFTKENGCTDLKGHRSVGGFRASIYNAMPKASVQHLVNLMQAFEKKHS